MSLINRIRAQIRQTYVPESETNDLTPETKTVGSSSLPSWSKLDREHRLHRLVDYALHLVVARALSEQQSIQLRIFLIKCHKYLKASDVIYRDGQIIDLPNLRIDNQGIRFETQISVRTQKISSLKRK